MSANGVKVVPLVCPDCGKSIIGLRYDRIFFCTDCVQGLLPGDTGQWERYPISFHDPGESSVAPALYLPFWEIEIEASGTAVNRQQENSLKLLDQLKSVWVAGFNVLRASYFGDLGLLYTEKGVRLSAADPAPRGAFITGCTRTMEEAFRYVELYVTLILDKRADVTGLELEISKRGERLWGVPFADRGEKIVDLVMGAELPVFALDDLEDMRRVRRSAR